MRDTLIKDPDTLNYQHKARSYFYDCSTPRGIRFYTNPFEVKYSTMTATDWVTSSSFVFK